MDYSKWDHIELSDDEDIEVHPNIDKKSFILFKQRQIHEQRAERRAKIDHYTKQLPAIKATISALIQRASGPNAEILDEVARDIIRKHPDTFTEERAKLEKQRDAMEKELKKLKHEEDSTLSFDKLSQTGFQKTIVRQKDPPSHVSSSATSSGTETAQVSGRDSEEKAKTKTVIETLNEPRAEGLKGDKYVEDPLLGKFGRLKTFEDSFQFISDHNSVVSQDNSDTLMLAAFRAEMDGLHQRAKNYVHQALALQYSSNLGKDGIGMFFHRMKTGHPPSMQMFSQDLEKTYAHIRTRSRVLAQKSNAPDGSSGGHIDLDPNDKEKMSLLRELPEDIKQALLAEDLDEVNKALGQMEVAQANSVLRKLHDAGIMQLEDPDSLPSGGEGCSAPVLQGSRPVEEEG